MPAESTFTTTHHALALTAFAAVAAGFVFAGRVHDRAARHTLAAVSLGAWLLSSVFYLLPANLELDKSLPIQACDLLALFAAITLAWPSRLMRAVLYFGGFGMTTQAFATPTSDIGGPDSIKFWIFWLLHGAILAAAIYIVAVDRFRPVFKDLLKASAFWMTYAVAMVALNYATFKAGLNDGKGWYYGYLGPHVPEIVSGSIISKLGGWPVRPILMMLIIQAIFVQIYLPWVFIPKRDTPHTTASNAQSSVSASSP